MAGPDLDPVGHRPWSRVPYWNGRGEGARSGGLAAGAGLAVAAPAGLMPRPAAAGPVGPVPVCGRPAVGSAADGMVMPGVPRLDDGGVARPVEVPGGPKAFAV